MTKAIVIVRVSYHPSGNFTLTRQNPGVIPEDVTTPERDAAVFYRKVAAFLGELAAQGTEFSYVDTDLDLR